MGIIDRYPTYKGGKVTEVVVYANYKGICRFYRYVVNISRWSPYEGGQLDGFYCIFKLYQWQPSAIRLVPLVLSTTSIIPKNYTTNLNCSVFVLVCVFLELCALQTD